MGEGGEKLERESEGEACGRGAVMMDTPDRSRIATPISKFEDSPVFNYINNLSPIETVKPVRISQTFNSYSFTSVPPIFTSPHVSSLKETRFLRRHQLSDPSKPENGNKLCTNEGATKIANKSEEQQESFDPVSCIGEPLNEAKLENKVSHIQNYDCCGPEDSTMSCHGMEAKCVSSKLGSTSGSVVPFVQEGPTSGLSKNTELINGEEGSSDWVNLISDAADFLVFESPSYAEPIKGSFHKSLDSEMELHTSHKTQADGLSQISEGHLNEIETAGDILACTSLDYQASGEPSEAIENESASNLQRGIRRRCLVFEMGGARRMYMDGSSSSGSSMLSKSHIETDDKQPIPLKPDNNSSRCILPGIGLHLNALARTSKEYTANHDNLASQRKSINDPSSNASIDSFTTNQETVNNSLALISMERDVVPVDGGRHGTQDAYQVSGYLANDDFNQGSPKKKKRKLENGETEGCKRCNCKKSKCLKLYCECFAAGVYCVEPCSCQDCFNKPIHEDTVLSTRKQIESRNPLAFAPKVIRTSDFVPETGDESINTPASARHKRGCNCKKSGCLKKYCECYQGGVGCSINCRCEGCKNAFGRKDGSFIGVEAEVEGTETHEKSIVDRNLQKNLIPSGAEQNPDSALPATPLRCGRASVQLPFSSKGKPPRSFLSIGSSSSTVYGGQKFGIPNFLQPQPKFEKCVQTNSENDIPEILQGNCSPINGIKSGSPNSKRVSPPHCDSGSSSPARRSSRKLILQSIPSFPSLKD